MKFNKVDYQREYNKHWSRPSSGCANQHDDLALLTTQIEVVAGYGNVLDVGCGDGLLVQALCAKGIDARGLDVSNLAVDVANSRCLGRFSQGSVLSLPHAQRSVDTVICINLLEHIVEEDVSRALAEVARVARHTVYLRITLQSDGASKRRTLESREWWEQRCFEAGLRRHPRLFQVIPFDEAAYDGDTATLLLEPIPSEILAEHPLSALREERDLHMDMGRETGRRSDAHMMRYFEAARYVRPGDRVLDAACGLGYGANILRHNSLCESVLGIDSSRYAVSYANANYSDGEKVSFSIGSLPDCLCELEPGSFDFVASFETLEHLEDPLAFLAACKRLLSPGGRIMVSVPNDWTEEDGKDPNPHHFHVYDWPSLLNQVGQYFLVEKAFCQTASRRKRDKAWIEHGREWREIPLAMIQSAESEWCLALAMTDPLSTQQPFEDRHNKAENVENLPAVIDFAHQYRNPWIISSLISIGLRTENADIRANMARHIIENDDGPDAAAALCIEGYQLLAEQDYADLIRRWHARIVPFVADRNWHESEPIEVRWAISLLFVSALLRKKIGDIEVAFHELNTLVEIPFLVYSPLIATKVIDARFRLGLREWASGRAEQGRKHFLAGIQAAQSAVTAQWQEVFGPLDRLPRFVMAELAEIMDLATRCTVGLRHIGNERPSGRITLDVLWNRGYELRNWQRTTTQLREVIEKQLRPELQRSQAVIDELWTTRCEWYEPQLERQQTEVTRLSAELESLSAQKKYDEAELARLRTDVVAYDKARREWYEPQLDMRQAEIERLVQANTAQEVELADQNAEMKRLKDEYYEPELARLRSNIEHSRFEKETQSLRSRLLVYAEQAKRADQRNADLKLQFAEKEAQYVAELARLNGAIAIYEKTKHEWWDPQLEMRAAHINALEEQIRLLRGAQ